MLLRPPRMCLCCRLQEGVWSNGSQNRSGIGLLLGSRNRMREVRRAYVEADRTLRTWFPSPISMGVTMMYLQMVGLPRRRDSRAR